MMIKCQNCGCMNFYEAIFCVDCGTKLYRVQRWQKQEGNKNRLFELVYLANSMRHEKNFDEAIQYCDKAIAIDPNYEPAWNLKGICYNQLGKYYDAERCYDIILKFNPNSIDALREKSFINKEIGNFKTALSCFEKLLENESLIKTDLILKINQDKFFCENIQNHINELEKNDWEYYDFDGEKIYFSNSYAEKVYKIKDDGNLVLIRENIDKDEKIYYQMELLDFECDDSDYDDKHAYFYINENITVIYNIDNDANLKFKDVEINNEDELL